MDLNGKKVTLHDMSLRDGMHAKSHQISIEEMVAVACGLDEAGMPLIEVTHGDGLGGASVNYGFPAHSDEEYLGAVVPKMKQARISYSMCRVLERWITFAWPATLAPQLFELRRTVLRPTYLSSTSSWGAI